MSEDVPPPELADGLARCNVLDCPATFPKHYWGKIKAHNAGWFTQRDGTVWCPEHLPHWVAGWRARRDRGA